MNYQRIYDSICNRAKLEQSLRFSKKKNKEMYFERHHVIPKCMGGSNDKENLVYLTAREHFVCHKLLCEIYPDNPKLTFALWNMSSGRITNNRYRYIISNREYERIKYTFSKVASEAKKGKTRWPCSEETKRRISESMKGKVKRYAKRKPMSEETKRKISEAAKLRKERKNEQHL